MEKILTEQNDLFTEPRPKPELTKRRRRFEERLDRRKIESEVDYLDECCDRIQH